MPRLEGYNKNIPGTFSVDHLGLQQLTQNSLSARDAFYVTQIGGKKQALSKNGNF
jgi:hypothetical protein